MFATTRDDRHSPTVSVVIPALNEENNLPLVLEGLPPVDEIVIVDGGSADDTVAIAREMRPDAIVVRQTRTGKGNALACGFAATSGDIVVTLNADGSTDPGEIPRYVDALLSGAEVAHGSRYLDGGGDLVGHRLDRLGNALLSRFVNALFGTRFTDLGYGYNAYWRALLPMLDLLPIDAPRIKRGRVQWGDGPEIEPLINVRTAAQGMRVVEVASVGYPPMNGARDRQRLARALRAMRVAFAEYLRQWRIGRRAAPEGARHGTAGRTDTDLRTRRAALDDTATRLRREALYDTGTRLRIGSPDDTATRLRREQLYGSRARRRRDDLTDTGTHLRADTGSRTLTGNVHDMGTRMRSVAPYDTGARLRAESRGRRPTGEFSDVATPVRTGAFRESGPLTRHQSLYDTGSWLRHDDGGARHDDRARHVGSARHDEGGARHDDIGARHGVGTGAAAGAWRDLARGPRRPPEIDVRYDPAAHERHDLEPGARRSLPLYPAPDPSWAETSGRHAAIGEPEPHRRSWPGRFAGEEPAGRGDHPGTADRRRGYAPDIEDDAEDTGAHHIEPRTLPGDREVGGRRRRLEARERRTGGRPDLTIIPGGDGAPPESRPVQSWPAPNWLPQSRHAQSRHDQSRHAQSWQPQIWPPRGRGRESRDWEPRGRDLHRGEWRGPESRGGETTGGDSRGWAPGGWEPGEWEPGGWERRTPDGGRRPGHLRAIPGERSTR
jgi:hypothetical protein